MPHVCDPRFECHHFTNADALFRALAPDPRFPTDTPKPNFVFRGHKCSSWELRPSAFRKHSQQRDKTEAVMRVSEMLEGTTDNQICAEFTLLKLFVEACDRHMISLPEDSYAFRKGILNDQHGPVQSSYRNVDEWPPPQLLPLLAFAQHHGVPTRLIDWSDNALVAAFFAAEKHVRGDITDDLAIWALNLEFIHLYEHIEIVLLPASNSQRLGAQRGLFTILRPPMQRGQPLDIDHLTLVDLLESRNVPTARPKPLWKLTLPHSEAKRLLYLCWLSNVDAAFVYPDAAGAALAALDRATWLQTDPQTGRNDVTRAFTPTELASQRNT